ncbi:hypothetical protein K435DRAFT_881060, partial [Dendrothele bispora CBS 962.96]
MNSSQKSLFQLLEQATEARARCPITSQTTSTKTKSISAKELHLNDDKRVDLIKRVTTKDLVPDNVYGQYISALKSAPVDEAIENWLKIQLQTDNTRPITERAENDTNDRHGRDLEVLATLLRDIVKTRFADKAKDAMLEHKQQNAGTGGWGCIPDHVMYLSFPHVGKMCQDQKAPTPLVATTHEDKTTSVIKKTVFDEKEKKESKPISLKWPENKGDTVKRTDAIFVQ